ncbi:hypothetical protein ACOSQ3_027310 [Xanthoceras sorbifolium]
MRHRFDRTIKSISKSDSGPVSFGRLINIKMDQHEDQKVLEGWTEYRKLPSCNLMQLRESLVRWLMSWRSSIINVSIVQF